MNQPTPRRKAMVLLTLVLITWALIGLAIVAVLALVHP